MEWVSVKFAGRMHRFEMFRFGSDELAAMHREIRCTWRHQFVSHRRYVVNHTIGNGPGPWTLNIAYEGNRSVEMLDLLRMDDGSFVLAKDVAEEKARAAEVVAA